MISPILSTSLSSSISSSTASNSFHIAIIGGGICGACIASALSKTTDSAAKFQIHVDLFDQGRSGVGGRTSHRSRIISKNDAGSEQEPMTLAWDHGCQFFRADTPRMANIVQEWMQYGLCDEWKGNFVSVGDEEISKNKGVGCGSSSSSFFGMPNIGPFYVGVGGMNSIAKGLLHQSKQPAPTESGSNFQLNIFEGTRVTGIERFSVSDGTEDVKVLWGLSGITANEAAFHDTAENKASQVMPCNLVDGKKYDAVVFTDISSTTFESWHRASANIPPDSSFVSKVKKRVGARVPLFTCLLAFDTPLPIEASAISFRSNSNESSYHPLWFACRTHHKPGFSMKDDDENIKLSKDCWTIVSTPEYAMQKIADTPMQDPTTGEFIPQSKDYLLSVPGPELEEAFRSALIHAETETSQVHVNANDMPKTIYMDAQRWGSAMPSHRHLCSTNNSNDNGKNTKTISNVAYDSSQAPLAPTKIEQVVDKYSFVADSDLMLVQAGDMVSNLTPGFESAALSGIDTAAFLMDAFETRIKK